MVFIKSFKNQTWLFPPAIEELEFLMKFVENKLETWAEQDSLEDDFFDNNQKKGG